MNDKQFAKLMKAISEVAWVIGITGLGTAILIAVIAVTLIGLL